MDKLFTFIHGKKQARLDYLVDRHVRCILGWKVAWERTAQVIQQLVDEAPRRKNTLAMAGKPMPPFGIT